MRHTIQHKFPAYFKSFTPPIDAMNNSYVVYRACETRKLEKESFLPSRPADDMYGSQENDSIEPSKFSLSTYENPKDVKRFATTNARFNPPWKIAVGKTAVCCGVSQRTKERKSVKNNNSHVDWWLYEDAVPHEHFELIDDFDKYLEEFKKGRQLK